MNLFRQLVGLLGWLISPTQGPYPNRTTQTQKNADTHPFLKWDLNSWSQCSSSQRQYVS